MIMKEKILSLREKGYTYRKIASELGISATKVSNILNNKFQYNKGHKRQRCIELRKSGMKVKDICKELGLCASAVSNYTRHLNMRVTKAPERRNEIIRLAGLGFDNNIIALNMGIKSSSVSHVLYKAGVRPLRWEYDNTEDKEVCMGLFVDGYPIDQISMITGLRLSEVKRYTRGCKVHKIKVPKKHIVVMKKKAKTASRPSAIELRALIGKGIEAGVYDTTVVLRDDRDKGRIVSFLYSDITDTPTIPISIRVKDDISDEEAVKRWCKRAGKKNWMLL